MSSRTKQAQTIEQSTSSALRRFLYTSAAFTGGAIMIIEILGAKMLAPFIGTSHFVWTAQIAVTLLALTFGYYMGGTIVDRSPRLNLLYGAILAAALYLCLIIPLVEPVAYWCLKYRLAVGSLLASLFLFFVPLSLLAMVGPFLARILTASLNNVGGSIGRLTAISTLGSVIGTVLIGYVLIPFMPNSVTMYLTAGILMALVAIYFFVWGRSGAEKTVIAITMGLGLIIGYGGTTKEGLKSTGNVKELYRGNSDFGLLQVLQNRSATRRFYLNDYLTQNTYDPLEKKSTSLFTYMLHDLAFAYTPAVKQALCIGMGVGIVPRQLASEGVKTDVVEINPGVVPIATNFFDCDISKFDLVIGDGRFFVNQTSNLYDAILLDAFLGDSSPSHLMTKEAFQSMSRVLHSHGTLIINSFGEFDAGKDFFMASLNKTLRSVFRSVRIHTVGSGNVFFVASNQERLEIVNPPDFSRVHSQVLQEARHAFTNLVSTNPDHGIVLTDNYNPVEFYDAGNREHWRRQFALSMRDL